MLGMAFKVRLVDDIEAELVAQLHEHWVVGIVGGSHSVDVVRLHRDQLGSDLVARQRFSSVGVMVMSIDAVEQLNSSVDLQAAVSALDASKADAVGQRLHDPSTWIDQARGHVVEPWVLVRPRFNVQASALVASDQAVEGVGVNERLYAECRWRRSDGLATDEVERGNRHLGVPSDGESRGRPHSGLDLDRTELGLGVEIGVDHNVIDANVPHPSDGDRAMNAAVEPMILILDPGCVRPPTHRYRQLVLSAVDHSRKVERGR